MEIWFAISFAFLDAPVTGRDIRLHPYQGTDACLVCFFLELPRPVHVAMIGDCEGRHFELERPFDQVIDSICAVEEGIFGVTVEMDEGHISL
jgi:hypothetical protein